MGRGIELDENRDLVIINGDLRIADTDAQDIEGLLLYTKGDIANDPLYGAEISRLANTRQQDWVDVQREVLKQMEGDGFKSITIDLTNGEIGGRL